MGKQIESLKKNKKDSDNRLKKMLQMKSFETVMQAKMRNDTASAFGMFWKQGSNDKKMKNPQLFTEKENMSLFGDKKRKRVDDDPSLLEKLSK